MPVSGINAQAGGEQEEVLVLLLWQENSTAVGPCKSVWCRLL